MSNFFSNADVSDVTRYEAEGGAWIELRNQLSKREMNDLFKKSPQSENDRSGVISFSTELIQILFSGWSNVDEHGNEVEFNAKTFNALAQKPAQWIEKTVGEHFRTITGTEVEELEKKPEE